MDILVTTPKTEMRNAAREAERCIADGGGRYFRRFNRRPKVEVGDKVFYVEDGYVRGYGVIDEILESDGITCDTTGRAWPEGVYVFMQADSWMWICPFPHKGFQGYRYFHTTYEVVGDWLSPKPGV